MPDGNQDDLRPAAAAHESSPLDDAASHDPAAPDAAAEPSPAGDATGRPFAARPHGPIAGALLVWLVLLLVFGVGALLVGYPEAAVLVALAGLLVAAQAADLDPELIVLHQMTAWVVPVGGLVACAMFAGLLGFMPESPGASPLGLAVCVLGVLAIVPSTFRAPGAALARGLLREPEPTSRFARLVARLVVVSLVVGLCGIAAYPQLYELLVESTEPLFDTRNALGDIVGYVLVAFAAVGFLLRRDFGATLERLGLLHTRPQHLLVIPLGVLALLALNSGAEVIETRFFPALAEADRRMTEVIAGELGLAGALVLGLTAGIGEEITLRGALQPRLGIVLTALVFALYHVQYTWFGILVVFALGLVFGLIRRHTTTTVAIGAHAAYDVVVALSLKSG